MIRIFRSASQIIPLRLPAPRTVLLFLRATDLSRITCPRVPATPLADSFACPVDRVHALDIFDGCSHISTHPSLSLHVTHLCFPGSPHGYCFSRIKTHAIDESHRVMTARILVMLFSYVKTRGVSYSVVPFRQFRAASMVFISGGTPSR